MKKSFALWVILGLAPLACGRAGLEDDLVGGGGSSAAGGTGGTGGTGATGAVGGFGGGPGGSGGFGGGPGGAGGVGGFGGGPGGSGGVGGFGGGPGGSGGFGGGPQGNCCFETQAPGCTQPGVPECVCKTDSFCCEVSWDSICVDEVTSLNCGSCGGTGGVGGGPGGFGGVGGFGGGPGGSGGFGGGPGGSGGFGGGPGGSGGFGGGPGGSGGFGGGPGGSGGFGGVGGFGGSGGTGGAGNCCVVTQAPGCLDPKVAACVCASDGFCCQVSWDQLCVNEVDSLGCGTCGGSGGAGGGGGIGGSGGFGGSGGVMNFCGDGVPGPNEQCDLGPANENRPAFEIQRGNFVSPVVPLDLTSTVQSFYGYSSASSHTGFEAAGGSRLMLHRNVASGQLSLVMHHGIDFDSSGIFQPNAAIKFDISGLPTATFVTVVDDTLSEFNKSSGTTAFGSWQFVQNSDGGALTGFPVPGNWKVVVLASVGQGISNWAFVNGNKAVIGLGSPNGSPLVIQAYDSPSKCRTNCTIPKCGDGTLDGGEVCDDGNNVGGDGCSSDCKALK